MKKLVYAGVLTCGLMALGGCAQKKVITPPPTQPDYSRTGSPATGYQLPEEAAKTTTVPGSPAIQEGQPIAFDDEGPAFTSSAMEFVTERITAYTSKLERWQELDSQSAVLNLSEGETEEMVRCFRDLQMVIKGYGAVREDLLQNNQTPGYEGSGEITLKELGKKDIAFLESPCGRLLSPPAEQAAGRQQQAAGTDLGAVEERLISHAASQEYEEVVQTWLQIPKEQLDSVDLQVRLLYADALMYLHQEEAAAENYQQIVDTMSPAGIRQETDLLSLRRMLADLYTASGNRQMAVEQYRQISGDYQRLGQLNDWSRLQLSLLENSPEKSAELQAYAALLRNYLGFIPAKDGYKLIRQADEFKKTYPLSVVAPNVDVIRAEAGDKAQAWSGTVLAEADRLGSERNYQEAIDLLSTIPPDILDEQRQVELNAKKDDFVLAEAVERETRKLEQVQDLQRKWNNGMLLLKGERFDEAIDQFTELLDTEYSLKAQEKIREVSLLAAREDRRKAADLFVKYTRTTDLETRKNLLLESRRLLKDILVKYPQADIIDKVKGNISRVEQEMNALDPNLLAIADSAVPSETSEPADPFDIGTGAQPAQSAQDLPIIQQ